MEYEMNVVVEVTLDKFVVGLKCPQIPKGAKGAKLTEEEKQSIHADRAKYLVDMKNIETQIKLGKHFVQKTGEKGLRRYCVLSEFTDAPLFYVQLGNIKGTWVINFEWNPSKLSPVERAEFLGSLEPMLNEDYHELYYKGVVSRAEFAVDVYGAEIADLVLIEKGRKSFHKEGATIYSGRRGSPHVLTMYDKAKQLGELGPWVRIEGRISRRDITFRQLVEDSLVGNPFGNAIIVDVKQLQLVASEFDKPQLAAHIMELGLQGAVKYKPLRLKILSRLQEVAVEWWKPELFWNEHQALLKELHPHKFQ
jgi:hypothetical protein